jgi:CDK inhibitor PHO81
MVPALVESVKVAGLVLVTDTSGEEDNGEPSSSSYTRLREGIDGVLKGNGVLRFNETIDM